MQYRALLIQGRDRYTSLNGIESRIISIVLPGVCNIILFLHFLLQFYNLIFNEIQIFRNIFKIYERYKLKTIPTIRTGLLFNDINIIIEFCCLIHKIEFLLE